MSDTPRGRGDADHCFVCGPENPQGLRIAFRLDGERCVGEFTPGPHHVGFDQTTHGGIVFSALDDVMANWLFLQGARGFTAKCEIRYRQPLPVGTAITLEARCKQRKGRLCVLEGSAKRVDNGSLVASTEASFMIDDFGALARE
jgi:acyl-coenzyme A thioesterase PaaI-like protein